MMHMIRKRLSNNSFHTVPAVYASTYVLMVNIATKLRRRYEHFTTLFVFCYTCYVTHICDSRRQMRGLMTGKTTSLCWVIWYQNIGGCLCLRGSTAAEHQSFTLKLYTGTARAYRTVLRFACWSLDGERITCQGLLLLASRVYTWLSGGGGCPRYFFLVFISIYSIYTCIFFK